MDMIEKSYKCINRPEFFAHRVGIPAQRFHHSQTIYFTQNIDELHANELSVTLNGMQVSFITGGNQKCWKTMVQWA